MCNDLHTETNPVMDDTLIEAARRVSRRKAKRQAVTVVPAEHVKRSKQLRIVKAFRTLNFDPNYDYKAERRQKRS
jgi:hypothetical protein